MATQPPRGQRPAAPAPAARSPEFEELKVLGKYVIAKRLGAGGMGTVYLATDTQLKRTVALKVLPKEKAENEILVQRFRAEAQAAALLRHQNIVMVYEAGAIEGHLYIALEYVDGIDVHVLVSKKGPLPVERSIDIVKQVCRALDHAFQKGIVHRDIKPSNLLIMRNGTVKLADMGLARSVDDTAETSITRAGTTVGTVDYMAPEQARDSKSADIRSDIYSLGCTWYQMLTARPPYPEGSLTNKLAAHASQALPDPREFNADIPEGVVAVLHRMMAKAQKDRYATPADVLADLEQGNITREAVTQRILDTLSGDNVPATAEKPRRDGGRPSSGSGRLKPPSSSGGGGKNGKGSSSRIRTLAGATGRGRGNNPSSATVRKPPVAGRKNGGGAVNSEMKDYAIVGGGVAAIVIAVMALIKIVETFSGGEPSVPPSPFTHVPVRSLQVAQSPVPTIIASGRYA